MTVDGLAAAAGVGKQTIYRWWPSKAAVLVEAMTTNARIQVPTPDTGSLEGDLDAFFDATFRSARNPAVSRGLRTVMAEAQTDPQAAQVLRRFSADRRSALRHLFEREESRGQASKDAQLDLLVDQAFGVLWYRMLVGHTALTRADARALAAGLTRQAR